MKKELIITKDGSHSLFVRDLKETYHSVHGSISESMHVFINSGLHSHPKKNINILEIGFGTGLNTLLTLENIKNPNSDDNNVDDPKPPKTPLSSYGQVEETIEEKIEKVN